ncbi:MAG: ATP-binding protein [Prolixibacteraceae bacterium]|nr:ATP-binding protein [Prolixibacteraceae bacterium]
MRNRRLANVVLQKSATPYGRIIVFTGARQTGKTTLARKLFPDYEYISVEDPVMRSQYAQLAALQWKALFPLAILDEIQKEPRLIESIKSVYDQWPEPRYILLGSSQLLLLEKVRESLVGRCTILELFPLTLPELRTNGWDDFIEESVFQQFVGTNQPNWLPSFLFDKKLTEKQQAWQHYTRFGSYPAVSGPESTEQEKYEWLKNYVKTYLERDIRDLAAFRDLEPFVKLQRYLAINTGNLINASAIATQLGINAKTVSRYIQYFEISYQAVLLPAWSRNENKRLVKTPKVHYLDPGIIQTVLQKYGGITGNEFESMVISEIYKQIKTMQIPANFFHIRTQDGREIDLLIELPEGYLAFEIKMKDIADKQDARHLTGLEEMLDKPLLHSFILTNDVNTRNFGTQITAIHVAHFLG